MLCCLAARYTKKPNQVSLKFIFVTLISWFQGRKKRRRKKILNSVMTFCWRVQYQVLVITSTSTRDKSEKQHKNYYKKIILEAASKLDHHVEIANSTTLTLGSLLSIKHQISFNWILFLLHQITRKVKTLQINKENHKKIQLTLVERTCSLTEETSCWFYFTI